MLIAVSDTGVGMSAETPAADLRAVLHDQGARPRHRPGSRDRVRHRHPERRLCLGLQRRGRGTVFKVYLPPTDQPPQPVAAGDRAAETHALGSELVLIVEDDRCGARSCRGESSNVPAIGCVEAANPEVAEGAFTRRRRAARHRRHHARRERPRPLSTLLARKPTLKVLFTSGYTDDMIARHGRMLPTRRFSRNRSRRTRCARKSAR